MINMWTRSNCQLGCSSWTACEMRSYLACKSPLWRVGVEGLCSQFRACLQLLVSMRMPAKQFQSCGIPHPLTIAHALIKASHPDLQEDLPQRASFHREELGGLAGCSCSTATTSSIGIRGGRQMLWYSDIAPFELS